MQRKFLACQRGVAWFVFSESRARFCEPLENGDMELHGFSFVAKGIRQPSPPRHDPESRAPDSLKRHIKSNSGEQHAKGRPMKKRASVFVSCCRRLCGRHMDVLHIR